MSRQNDIVKALRSETCAVLNESAQTEAVFEELESFNASFQSDSTKHLLDFGRNIGPSYT